MRHVLPLLPICIVFATVSVAEPPDHARWKLTFSDDFEGDSVDWDVWKSQSAPRGGERLEGRWPENNVVRDGILHQVTKRQEPPRGGKNWSTAHIWTRNFTQKYGYFECRMRYGEYLNNAFWLFRPRNRFENSPHFEIDINEGHTPREVSMNYHKYIFHEEPDWLELVSSGNQWEASEDLDKGFHIYGCEWNKEQIIWYFDGRPIRVLTNHGGTAPVDVRLSTVILTRALKRDGVPLEQMEGVDMEVDWVRVYEKVADLREPELPEAERLELPEVVETRPRVDPKGTRTTLLKQTFEGVKSGELPDNWQIGEGEPKIVEPSERISAPQGKRALRLEPNDYAYRMFDEPIEGRLEIEFDCYIPRRKPNLLLVTLGQFDAGDLQRRRTSYYTGDIGPYIHWDHGFLRYYTEEDGWTRIGKWPVRAWSHARFLLDMQQAAFDAYRGGDNEQFVGSGPFRHKQSAARAIGLRHRGRGEPVYVDNIVVRRVGE